MLPRRYGGQEYGLLNKNSGITSGSISFKPFAGLDSPGGVKCCVPHEVDSHPLYRVIERWRYPTPGIETEKCGDAAQIPFNTERMASPG